MRDHAADRVARVDALTGLYDNLNVGRAIATSAKRVTAVNGLHIERV
jgi:hypothetical protein